MKKNILLSVTMTVLLFSCGIDEIPILSKPEKGNTSDIDKTFQFYITSENGDPLEPHFRGFEIYYKFYSSDAGGIATIEDESGLITFDDLVANSFRRVNYFISTDDCDKVSRVLKPMIKIRDETNRAQRSLLTIYFNDLDNVHITATPIDADGLKYFDDADTVTDLPIKRNIADPLSTDYFKSFTTYKTTDSDVAGNSTLGENRVLLVLYVLSYGKYNLSETVYSDALCLGRIELINITVE